MGLPCPPPRGTSSSSRRDRGCRIRSALAARAPGPALRDRPGLRAPSDHSPGNQATYDRLAQALERLLAGSEVPMTPPSCELTRTTRETETTVALTSTDPVRPSGHRDRLPRPPLRGPAATDVSTPVALSWRPSGGRPSHAEDCGLAFGPPSTAWRSRGVSASARPSLRWTKPWPAVVDLSDGRTLTCSWACPGAARRLSRECSHLVSRSRWVAMCVLWTCSRGQRSPQGRGGVQGLALALRAAVSRSGFDDVPPPGQLG